MSNFDDISNNAADFSRSLNEIADYVDTSYEKIVRKVCIDIYKAIVTKTPVLTGRAKASWGIDVNPSDYKAPDREYSEGEIRQMVSENVSEFKLSVHDGTVTIYNNLEYIEALEDGHSDQAPSGMVSLSLAAFTTKFNNGLRNFRGLDPI